MNNFLLIPAVTLILSTAFAFVGMALAQGGAGPPTPIIPFCMWEKQGAAGTPMTPMLELMRMARNGERLDNAPQPTERRSAELGKSL